MRTVVYEDQKGPTRMRRHGFWLGLLAGVLLYVVLRSIQWDRRPIERAAFNAMAPVYDSLMGLIPKIGQARPAAVDRLGLQPGFRVLEVAVGTGANLPYIAERIGPAGRIDGLDLSEGMLAQAQKKLGSLPCPIELRVGSAEDLPYADNSFDAVLCFGALSHFSDRKRAIDEMARVAKPGARIVIADRAVGPDGAVQGILSAVVQAAFPRLRPAVDLVTEPGVRFDYLPGGIFYVMDWRKPMAVAGQ